MCFLDFFGYFASLIILVSLLMSSLKKLRWINLIGAALFTVYGILIHTIPVAVMNFGIVVIDIYYLLQIYHKSDYFTLLDIEDNSVYLKYFIEFYHKNMEKFLAIDNVDVNKSDIRLYILRNVRPAGIFLASKYDSESLYIDLDYVIPEFQDFKMGEFIYEKQKEYFLSKGYTKLYAKSQSEMHTSYLLKMGFKPIQVKNDTLYLKEL